MSRFSLCMLLWLMLVTGYVLGRLHGERFVQQEAIARGLADPDVYGAFGWRFSRLDEQPKNGATPVTIYDFLRDDRKNDFANWRRGQAREVRR